MSVYVAPVGVGVAAWWPGVGESVAAVAITSGRPPRVLVGAWLGRNGPPRLCSTGGQLLGRPVPAGEIDALLSDRSFGRPLP